MLKTFEAELDWFTKRLLQIRLTEVRGFSHLYHLIFLI